MNIGGDTIIVYATSGGNLYILIESDAGFTVEKEDLNKVETTSTGDRITGHRKPSSICCNDIFILVGYEDVAEITCFKISNLSFLKRDREDIYLNTNSLYQVRSISVSE